MKVGSEDKTCRPEFLSSQVGNPTGLCVQFSYLFIALEVFSAVRKVDQKKLTNVIPQNFVRNSVITQACEDFAATIIMNNYSTGQEIPYFYGNRTFITVFTKAYYRIPIA
jgi:hypothetical protein